METKQTIEVFDLRTSYVEEGIPTGSQIKECRRLLGGWTQDRLAEISVKFGFPISQSEISLLERGYESKPTKAGHREIRRRAKSPSISNGYLDSGVSYRERVRILMFRLGFIFPDAERILCIDPKNYLSWLSDAADQAGMEGNFDGSTPEEDSERLWQNVRHYATRIYPDLERVAEKSAKERNRSISDLPEIELP